MMNLIKGIREINIDCLRDYLEKFLLPEIKNIGEFSICPSEDNDELRLKSPFIQKTAIINLSSMCSKAMKEVGFDAPDAVIYDWIVDELVSYLSEFYKNEYINELNYATLNVTSYYTHDYYDSRRFKINYPESPELIIYRDSGSIKLIDLD